MIESNIFIETISRSEFDEFDIGRVSPPFSSKEIAWFKMVNTEALGLLLKDSIDDDYTYITFKKESNRKYKIDKFAVSIPTLNSVEMLLQSEMVSHYLSTKNSESIYENYGEIEESKAKLISIDHQVKEYFKNHPEKMYNLSPRRFEELVAEIITDMGFDIELTKQTRDGGKDIIASVEHSLTKFIMYIECKKHSVDNKVGVGIVRELIGVHVSDKPNKSMIITTSFFTKDAKQAAKTFENQIELKDYNDLVEMLKEY